jgi:hypothetical protein
MTCWKFSEPEVERRIELVDGGLVWALKLIWELGPLTPRAHEIPLLMFQGDLIRSSFSCNSINRAQGTGMLDLFALLFHSENLMMN